MIKESNYLAAKSNVIAFAREILRDTPIYLLDEATSALDKASSTQLERLILTKQDKTVIMVTHHLRNEIEQLANKVVNLNEIKNTASETI